LPVGPYISPTSGFSTASDAELRAVPASLANVGGTAAPATAATPPDESIPYWLDPAQPGLPGVAVGLGPSSVTRLESGALPTSPSPPAAFAQPTEPNLRTLPATANGVAGIAPSAEGGGSSEPFSFRPVLVPATPISQPSAGTSAAGGLPEPAPTTGLSTQTTAPQSVTTDLAPVEQTIPAHGKGFEQATGPSANSVLYFLEEAGQTTSFEAPDFAFDPFGFPAATALEFGEFPFDSRNPNAANRPDSLPAELQSPRSPSHDSAGAAISQGDF
jgi:hypothetical protein